jgi:putative intracellular protease/amidase
MSKKVLIVLTSHDQLGDTGLKTGFWLEEFASPYFTFKDAGAEIVLASPAGGQPPLDPKSDLPDFQTEMTHRFKADPDAQQALAQTVKLGSVKEADFDTVFYPGGHGPMWDLAESKDSIALIEAFERAGKPIGFVCRAKRVHKAVGVHATRCNAVHRVATTQYSAPPCNSVHRAAAQENAGSRRTAVVLFYADSVCWATVLQHVVQRHSGSRASGSSATPPARCVTSRLPTAIR